MKKVFFLLILIASVSGSVINPTVNASTGSTALKTVTVELTVKSPGAGGSHFVLKGLQTPKTPTFACTKTSTVSEAFGDGTSVHFALVDVNGVDNSKITVRGTVIGRLAVINDTYIDPSGKSIVGNVAVRQYKW
jgi:hypothetical protein